MQNGDREGGTQRTIVCQCGACPHMSANRRLAVLPSLEVIPYETASSEVHVPSEAVRPPFQLRSLCSSSHGGEGGSA